ncbi:hypothetical protein [Streptomyces sp. NBC_00829]|uniref:hypothetical protein n=1 Tax=Streptomyces sp. NBC_00829 TaxID=2903679 RepID=UPI00386FC5C0|nr:hypothetical protein OG293_40080 [Streptomyces sp. NBC_00829]
MTRNLVHAGGGRPVVGPHSLVDADAVHRATHPTVRARRRRPPTGAAPSPARSPRALGHHLAPWATALSAVAAAIGLFFSGTVASSSVRATRQQLEQDQRQQAGRLAYWTEKAGESGETVIVVNRSLDPVTRVEVLLYLPRSEPGNKLKWIFLGLDAIPPCTRLVFTPGVLGHILDLLGDYKVQLHGTPIRAIQFVDSDGRHWLRDAEGLRAAKYERKNGLDISGDLQASARQEPVQHCDK